MSDANVRPVLFGHLGVFAAMTAGLYVGGYPPAELIALGWWWPYLVVHAGVLAGNVGMMWLASRPDHADRLAAEGRREDLQDSRELVVEQLRVLESERDKLAPDDYARERAALLSVGAEASRELDEGPPTLISGTTTPGTVVPTVGPADTMLVRLQSERERDPAAFDAAVRAMGFGGTSGPSGEWKGAMYALAMVALGVMFFWLADDSARTRAPGMSMTGGDQVMGDEAPPAQAPPSADADPRVMMLEQRLEADPEDVEALNALAQILAIAGDQSRAMGLSDRAMALAPDAPDTKTSRAILQASVGLRDKAVELLDEVLAAHPDHVPALFYLAVFELRDNPARAVELLERATALDPSPALQAELERARQLAAGGGATAAPTPPPQRPAAPAAAPGEPLVGGTIVLSEGIDPAGAQSVFVSVKDASAGGGPPLAAVKLPPGPFPLAFQLTTGNILPMNRGRPLPSTLSLTVTLNRDGQPMAGPGEPTLTRSDVTPGAEDLTLTLPVP